MTKLTNGMVAKCSLCSMELPVDDCWDNRKSQHETFHAHRTTNNRINVNTVVGIVKWVVVNDIINK